MEKTISALLIVVLITAFICTAYVVSEEKSIEERISELEKRISILEEQQMSMKVENNMVEKDESPEGELLYSCTDPFSGCEGTVLIYYNNMERVQNIVNIHITLVNETNVEILLLGPNIWLNSGDYLQLSTEDNYNILSDFRAMPYSTREGVFRFHLDGNKLKDIDFADIYMFELGIEVYFHDSTVNNKSYEYWIPPTETRHTIEDFSLLVD